MGQYQHRTYRTIAMLRGGLVSIIYRKTSTLSLKDMDPATSMTLMSADMERIVQGWQTMHEIWGNSVEVGVAIYLLEAQLGVACVVPVAVSIRKQPGTLPDYPAFGPSQPYAGFLTLHSILARLHLRHELHHVPPGDVA
jgi:hypothetical protein